MSILNKMDGSFYYCKVTYYCLFLILFWNTKLIYAIISSLSNLCKDFGKLQVTYDKDN